MIRKTALQFFGFLFFSMLAIGQTNTGTISGMVKSSSGKSVISYANIVLKKEKDSAFVTGTVSGEDGRFFLSNIKSGNYIIQFSFTGFSSKSQPVLVGSLNAFFDLGTIELQQEAAVLNEVVVISKQDDVILLKGQNSE